MAVYTYFSTRTGYNIYLSTLYLLVLSVVCVPGDLVIRQVNTQTTESWIVRRIATYEHGGSNPSTFNFQCTSTINDGQLLFWRKIEDTNMPTQQRRSDGIELVMDAPIAGYAGTYECFDDAEGSSDVAEFILTDVDPASLAEASSLTYYVGETAVINMFASTLSSLTDDLISWTFNNSAIKNGVFSNNKTTLQIPNVQLANAGVYKIIITKGTFGLFQTNSSNTTLQVLDLPKVTDHPLDQTVSEWNTVEMNCTAIGGSTLQVSWFRINGTLPPTASNETTMSGSTVISTLTITNVRRADSGSYYCNASVTEGSHYNISNTAVLTVNDNVRLTYSPTGGNTVILSDPLLFIPSSIESFTVDCEGSGDIYWTGPDPTVNVSSITTSNPRQQFLVDGSYSRLNFTSALSFTSGLYNCLLNGRSTSSIYVTNDNPAIYTEKNEVIVGLTTNVVLRVYVDGENPAPSADSISWFFDGNPLPDAPHYTLLDDNKELMISDVFSNITTGTYQSTVTTSQGTQSVFINVSYYDPPVVKVYPEEETAVEGSTVVFNCTAESVLSVTVAWYNSSNSQLLTQGGVLTLSNVTRHNRGTYYCEVVDSEGIYRQRKEATLAVQYKPLVTLLTIGNDPQSSLSVELKENSQMPTYFCSVDAYPSPTTFQWRHNGGELPDGVMEGVDGDYRKLSWRRNIDYTDNGTFICTAANSIGESSATLSINVYAIPTITTIYSSVKGVSLSSVSPVVQLTVPSFSTGPVDIVCLAHGLPVPAIEWVDSRGQQIEHPSVIPVSKPCGVIRATLQLNASELFMFGSVQCRVVNQYGSDAKNVTFKTSTVAVRNDSVSSFDTSVVDGTMTEIRLKLNTSECTANTLSEITDPLISALRSVVVASTLSCNLDISLSERGCDGVSNSSIFVIAISTSTSERTVMAVSAVHSWIATDPVLLSTAGLLFYRLDSNCDLTIQNSQQKLSCNPSPVLSTSLPPSTDPTVIPTDRTGDMLLGVWIAIVVVIVILLLIVVAALIVVLYLCIKTMKRKGEIDIATAQAWSSHSLDTWRTSQSAHLSSQEISTEFNASTSHQFNMHDSSSSSNGMLNNPQYTDSQIIQTIRQEIKKDDMRNSVSMLPTSPPQEQVDSPSRWVDGTEDGSGYVMEYFSQDSLRSATPINEKQYQPAGLQIIRNGTSRDDPTYAAIRPNARVEQTQQHHHSHATMLPRAGSNMGVRNINGPLQQRRATLPSQLRISPAKLNTSPTRRPSAQSPVHYSEPHSQPQVMSPGRKYSGSGKWTASSPSLQQPVPYSQPVSSMSSLRNVGMKAAPPHPPHTNRSISSPSGGSEHVNVQRPTLNTLSEHVVQGPWYQSEENDIVTPSSNGTQFSNMIEPYAMLLSPQLEPTYSQPAPDIQSTVSSSSPSTIRPDVHHLQQQHNTATVAAVQYETITV